MVKDMLGDFCDIQFLSHEELPPTRTTHEDNTEHSTSIPDHEFMEILTGYEFENGV